MDNRKLRRSVSIFWIINLVVGFILLGIGIFTYHEPFQRLVSISTSTFTVTHTKFNTFTMTYTSMSTPTLTPTHIQSHTPTLSPTLTFTPIPFSEGPIIIGYSVENRPIEVYRFGNGRNERLIVAGMHGGSEYNTIELADELIIHINEHPGIIPEYVTLYILRNLNPDGEAQSHDFYGRPNANDVDLNRNWDANWQQDWPRNNCWTYTYVTAGDAPGSEPETQSLMNFILSHNFDAILNYHSAALGIFPGGLPPEESTLHLAEAIAAVTTYSYPPINIGCVYTGGFTDWADEHGIPALDIELTNHTDIDFEMNLRVLEVLLNWRP